MVPLLSALSLALCHEALEGCGNHKMETSIAKRNFPSCSLHSQFTASQKLPLLFPNAKHMGSATGNQQMKPANGNHQITKRNFPSCSLRSQFTASQKLPLLFPNAKTYGISNWNQTMIPPYRPFQDKLPIVAKVTLPTCGSFCNDGSSIPATAIFECLACASHPNILSCRGSYCRNRIIRWNHDLVTDLCFLGGCICMFSEL